MERNEIIEGYIRFMRTAARLNDDILKRALNETIDENPEILEQLEKLVYKKDKMMPADITSDKGHDEKGDTVKIFDDINDALTIRDIERELRELGYTDAYKVIYNAIRDDLLYIDDIESDGTIYLALTDCGEALWELCNF